MKPWLTAMLAASLLASAGLAWWPDAPAADAVAGLLPPPRTAAKRQAGQADQPAARAPVTASTPGGAAAQRPAALPTRPADWPEPTPAALGAWQGTAATLPPPASTAAARPPLAPAQAAGPAFPYRWIGQLDDGDAPQVLLASAQRSVGVRLGATLDGRWRLLLGPGGVLQAQALPDGVPQAVPGAPPASPPPASPPPASPPPTSPPSASP